MDWDRLTGGILGAAFKVHSALGPGLLESAYEIVLAHELRKAGFSVQRQVPIPIIYDGLRLEAGFRADLVVNDLVIVELKSVESLARVHAKQVITQLRLSGKRIGLLINFGEEHLRTGIKRLVNNFDPE